MGVVDEPVDYGDRHGLVGEKMRSQVLTGWLVVTKKASGTRSAYVRRGRWSRRGVRVDVCDVIDALGQREQGGGAACPAVAVLGRRLSLDPTVR